MWSHRPTFATSLLCAYHAVQLRDALLHRVQRLPEQAPGIAISRHSIPSGSSNLDAVFVMPVAHPARASVLLCHGIAENVPLWFPIQHILAEAGIASLVFDYSGYGRSTGSTHWTQLEDDAIAAFQFLENLAPAGPISMLGFSLGTGILPAIASRVNADRLVLCAGYTSFRAAARAIGLPAVLTPFVPPIWDAKQSLPACNRPILVVHSTADSLFPTQMAHDLVSMCNGNGRLLLLRGFRHNEPVYRPSLSYWSPIAKFLTS